MSSIKLTNNSLLKTIIVFSVNLPFKSNGLTKKPNRCFKNPNTETKGFTRPLVFLCRIYSDPTNSKNS
jgi:hypothetical protein